jgi:hypothetical protein
MAEVRRLLCAHLAFHALNTAWASKLGVLILSPQWSHKYLGPPEALVLCLSTLTSVPFAATKDESSYTLD